MKSTFERKSNQIDNKKTITLTVSAIVFTATIYLIRAGSDEFSLYVESLSILAGFLCVVLIPMVGIAFFLTGRFIYQAFWHGSDRNGSIIPLSLLIGGTMLAVIVPLPPLAEEESFIKHRTDYEYIVTLAKSDQLEHGDCKSAFELPEEYKYLSEDCVFIHDYSGNIHVEFSPFQYEVRLDYFENPSDITKSRNCDFRGSIWKQINENWYVCKLSHTW